MMALETAEKKLSDGQKESKLWRGSERIYLCDGSGWEVVKVLIVTRYTVVARAKALTETLGESREERVLLLPKHAIVRADLRQQEPGVISSL